MADTEERWLTELRAERLEGEGCEKGVIEYDFAVIIKGLLEGKYDAEHAAKEADTYYWDRNLDSGPLFRYHPDGLGHVESTLYDIIFDMAQFLPYNDTRQEVLVQVILELHKIPPRPVKAWNGDLFVSEYLFTECLSNRWRDCYTHYVASEDEKNRWVSLVAFIARCIEHGIEEKYPDSNRYPLLDIPRGLERDAASSLDRNTWVMTAAQYILLAPTVIKEMVPNVPRSDGHPSWPDRIKLWGAKLKQLVDDGGLDPEVKEAAIAAREKLISMLPELFNA